VEKARHKFPGEDFSTSQRRLYGNFSPSDDDVARNKKKEEKSLLWHWTSAVLKRNVDESEKIFPNDDA
jgi:hypothetical protein